MKNDSIDYAVFYYEQNGNYERLAEAYNYKAMTLYFDQKKTKEAFVCLKKGETIVEKYGYDELKQKIYENLFVINFECKYYDTALEYGQKALHYAYKIKDTLSIAYDILYISDSYSALKNDDKAMQYNLKALAFTKYYSKLDNSILLGNIGEYYFEKGNTAKAEEFLNKAFKMSPTAYTYSVVADIYIKRGEYAKARELMAKSPAPLTDIAKYKKLSTIYDLNRKSGDYRQALDIADSLMVLNHVMDSVKEHENLNEIQAKFDRERAAQEFETRIVYIIGGLVLLILLVLFFIFRQKYKAANMRHDMMKNRLLINEYTDKIGASDKPCGGMLLKLSQNR